MVNKSNALDRIDKIKNYLRNIKTTAYHGNLKELGDQFEKIEEMIETLEGLISSEAEEYLNRPYGGL